MAPSKNQTMLRKIQQNLDELGTINSLLYLFNKLLYKVTFKKVTLHKYYITRQPVFSRKLVPANKALDIVIKQIYADDILLHQMDRPFSTLQARFNYGGNCFVALKRGEFAGNLWLNFKQYQEDEVRCTYVLRPSGQAAWDYDVFVVPEYRFSYTFAKLWDHANTVMYQRGVLYVYSRINFYNISSLQAHRRLGSEIIGYLVFITIGNYQISISTRFKPFLTISKSTFPELFIE